jgi:hypothetical protein
MPDIWTRRATASFFATTSLQSETYHSLRSAAASTASIDGCSGVLDDGS